MKLNKSVFTDKAAWEAKGYSVPTFDYEAVKAKTLAEPKWVHFGAGNIFRAFQANLAQEMLNQGLTDTGLIVVEGYDYEIIEKMYRPHDNVGALVTLKGNGSVEKTVIASIMESLTADPDNATDWERLKEIFRSPSLQMVTFTITEKGYSTKSYMSKVAALLQERIDAKLPLAMVSTDNCSHNGNKLRDALKEQGLVWDDQLISFPWSMIDKITPRPDAKIEAMLQEDGIEGLQPVITTKNTYVAPFVNAEECEYLVIEDNFPNGRMPLDKVGSYFTDRETVDKVEKMKVCTCLNPLHTCLAVFGCLLGYDLISKEMQDEDLLTLVNRLGYVEGLPVVVDPGILSPKQFIDEVVQLRIPNPFMPDTPQRIACDTSQKLSIRFGETIKAYLAKGMDLAELEVIPLVFAGWLRYLLAIDDSGKPFTLSPDPLLDDVCQYGENIEPLLHRKDIFGVDLVEVGLAEKVTRYFAQMLPMGGVRSTISKLSK